MATLSVFAFSTSTYAQLLVNQQTDLLQLARTITGPGVQITNMQINCASAGYGEFNYTGNNMDIANGIILATGAINNAIGPNNVENKTTQFNTPGNTLLNTVTGRTTHDACKFEFDIIPQGDTLRFNFVFASEEYNEWVGSQYNDVFGFFISGPGIVGDPGIGIDHNIALIPGTSQAVAINNVNNALNSIYFYDNPAGANIQYDGYTTGLRAVAKVQPCQTYHLKLIIADASDRKFDSGVFIERIESNPLSISSYTEGGTPDMVEGCNKGYVKFTRQQVTSQPQLVKYYIGGTATNGTDFPLVGNPVPLTASYASIPANQASTTITFNPHIDGILEPMESVVVYLGNPLCAGQYLDSTVLWIADTLIASVDPVGSICKGDSVQLHAHGGTGYTWSPNFNITDINSPDPYVYPTGTTTYQVQVTSATCVQTVNRKVMVHDPKIASIITMPKCWQSNDGRIDITVTGASLPAVYSWTGPNGFIASTQNVSGLGAGTYNVTLTDATGCVEIQSFNLNEPARLQATTSPSVLPFGQNISCFGGSDGSIDLTVTGGTGPYSYAWSGPNGYSSSVQDPQGVTAGNYTVVIIDVNGCDMHASQLMSQPTELMGSFINVSHNACFGTSNGSATLSPSGGALPYSYSWNTIPVQTTATATGLTTGGHTATLVDGHGCVTQSTVVINGPSQALVISIASRTHVSCFGDSTGSATVAGMGGTQPYSYSWNTTPIQGTATATGLTSGTYTVTCTDMNGCIATRNVTIQQPTNALSASIGSVTHVQCHGLPTGTATATGSGGTAPYSYSWNTTPMQTSAQAVGLSIGSHTVTVTDSKGCTSTNSVTINGPIAALSLGTISSNSVSCRWGNNGSATVEASGGTAPYLYAWSTSPVQSNATASGLSAGTYSVMVTDANGCSTSLSLTIAQPAAALNVNVSSISVQCHGGSSGSVTANTTGGTGPYTYSWNTTPVQSTMTATGLSAGNYSVSVLDSKGCIASSMGVVSQPTAALNGSLLSRTNVDCFGNATGTATVSVNGGSGAYSISWNTSPVQTGATATALLAGNYVATITDNNGCVLLDTVHVNIIEPATQLQANGVPATFGSGHNISCQSGIDGMIDLTVSGGTAPYTFAWSGPSSFNASIEDISNLVAGNYTVIVTDLNGCQINSNFSLTEPAMIGITGNITTAACQGTASGAVDATVIGGIPPYSYSWSGPNAFIASTEDISSVPSGTYTLTVTDANNCSGSQSFNVSEPGSLSLIYSTSSYAGGFEISCAGAANGFIDATVSGGVPPYMLSWTGPNGFSSANEDINSLVAGNYLLVANDQNGCSTDISVQLSQPPPFTISLAPAMHPSGSHISCSGANDGGISATITGGTPPYMIAWSNGGGFTSSNEDITGLSAGTYIIDATDANGCAQQASVSLTAPSALTATVVLSQANDGSGISCTGGNDGSIDLTVNGGSAPYSYSWTGPNGYTSSMADINDIGAGSYLVTIIDLNGCTTTASAVLTEPLPLSISISTSVNPSGDAITCYGSNDGSIDLEMSGGAGPYTYLWTGPNGFTSINEDISTLFAGGYQVTITDQNGCQRDTSFSLTEPMALGSTHATSNFNGHNVSCSGGNDGMIQVFPNGGTAPYSYLWNGPSSFTSTNDLVDSLTAGSYSVVITDANGCSSNASFILTEPIGMSVTAIPVEINGYQVTCAGANDGAVNTTVSGGVSPYSFLWTGPGGLSSTSQDLSGLSSGGYNLVVTDANGCQQQVDVLLIAPAPLSHTAILSDHNGVNTSCAGANDGSIDLTVMGGAGGLQFSWTGPNGFVAYSEDIAQLIAGTYNLTVNDTNGCSVTGQYVLTSAVSMTHTMTISSYQGGFNVSCSNATDGSINLSIMGGSSPYSFQWYGPNAYTNNTEDISGIGTGNYSVVVTDANGCMLNANFDLTAPPQLQLILNAPVFNGGFHVPCNGDAMGSIAASVVGGTPYFNYQWSGPNGYTNNDPQIAGLSAGIYSLLVTDTNNCTGMMDLEITQPGVLSLTSQITDHAGYAVSCNGNDGAIDVTVVGGTSSYTFSWIGPNGFGSISEDLIGLAAGTYDLVVTDANNCKVITQFTLTRPDPIVATFTLSDHNGSAISCAGGSDGSIDMTVTGGVPPLNTNWIGPNGFTASTEDIASLEPGTYTVSITDNANCVAIYEVVITAPDTLSIQLWSQQFNGNYNIQCVGDTTGVVHSTVLGGTGPFTYSWTGPNGSNTATANITDVVAGAYSLIITDANGCMHTDSIMLTEPSQPISAMLTPFLYPSGTNISCFGAFDGSIDASVVGGTPGYEYFWRGPDSAAFQTQDISGLQAGVYDLVIVDDNQCTYSISTTLLGPDELVLDSISTSTYAGQFNIPCAGGNEGWIDIHVSGGNIGLTYQWSGPNSYSASISDIDSLLAGTYIIAISDVNGCVISDTVELVQPDTLQLDITANTFLSGTNISCNGMQDGSIQANIAGGAGGFGYNWNGPGGWTAITQNVTGLGPGTYCLVLTDLNGCVTNDCTTLVEPTSIQLTATTSPDLCGQLNGSIDLTAQGGSPPYEFMWTDGENTEDIQNKATGNYTVHVTDINGCSSSLSVFVSGTSGIVVDAQVSEPICFGTSDGAVDITVLSGTAPYIFTWSNHAITEDVNGLPAGSITINIVDGAGCSFDQQFIIQENTPITIDSILSNYTGGYHISSAGGADGWIAVTPQGSVPPYTYEWSNGDVNATSTGLTAGEYAVTVTDAYGCTSTFFFSLTEPLGLEMPTGFTPNGDGANDSFVIHGIEAYPNNSFTVFNRWGNVVYTRENYQNDWRGENQGGVALPNATYFILLDLNDGEINLKSYVDLRR